MSCRRMFSTNAFGECLRLFQLRSKNNEVPKPRRATFEKPPVKLGDKGLEKFKFLRKENCLEILSPSSAGGISDAARRASSDHPLKNRVI